MLQMDLEQRQSIRFERPFLVTTHEDTQFQASFSGEDVNLTGISFWVEDGDLFLPGQSISLCVKNLQLEEVYCLEAVEVVHQQVQSQGILCGCHLSQVTSAQLLSHHRMVANDAQSALVSMNQAQLSEFDFKQNDSPISQDEADYQEASMAISLAVSQFNLNRVLGAELIKEMRASLSYVNSQSSATLSANCWQDLSRQLFDFEQFYQHMGDTTKAWTILAKLLAHTPNNQEDKQAWQTLIADFEKRFLSPEQQMAYDFMHQGMSAEEAMEQAKKMIQSEVS